MKMPQISYLIITILFSSCNNSTLPVEYKAYKTLDEGIISKHFKLKLLFRNYFDEAGVGFQTPIFYITINHNVIIELKKKGNEYGKYYKLDSSGKVTDSISTLARKEQTDDSQFPTNAYLYDNIKGFLIDDINYNTWGIDGNSSDKPLQVLNQKLNWDKQEIKHYLKENLNIILAIRDNEVYLYSNGKLSILHLPDTFESDDFEEIKIAPNRDNLTIVDFINHNRIDYFQKISSKNIKVGGSSESEVSYEQGFLGNWFTSIYFEKDVLKIQFKDVALVQKDFGKNSGSFYSDRDAKFKVSSYQFPHNNFGILYLSIPDMYYIIERK